MSDWTEIIRCRVGVDDVSRAAQLLAQYLGTQLHGRRSVSYAQEFYHSRTQNEEVLLFRNEGEDGEQLLEGFPVDVVVLQVFRRVGADDVERAREIEHAVKRAEEREN